MNIFSHLKDIKKQGWHSPLCIVIVCTVASRLEADQTRSDLAAKRPVSRSDFCTILPWALSYFTDDMIKQGNVFSLLTLAIVIVCSGATICKRGDRSGQCCHDASRQWCNVFGKYPLALTWKRIGVWDIIGWKCVHKEAMIDLCKWKYLKAAECL